MAHTADHWSRSNQVLLNLVFLKRECRQFWVRLIDGIEPEILSAIERAPTHVAGVLGVHDVRARWVGHKVYTDVAIAVDPALSVRRCGHYREEG